MEDLSEPELPDTDSEKEENIFSDIEEDINDDIFNIDINYYYDDYYINKYNDLDMFFDIKDNMNLCIEYNCLNIKEIDEDMCILHIEDQKTVNEYETFNEFIESVINGYMKEDIIYDIIKNNQNPILPVLRNEDIDEKYNLKYLINIENNIIKEYINYIHITYVKDIIHVEDELTDIVKPDVNIVSFNGKVDYLDHKVEVYKFPIPVNKIYSDIYNKYILYYKHVCNNDINKRHIEPYVAYLCCIENGKQVYDTISFIKLFKILNIVYNKLSIINHIKYITRDKLDISELINK